MRGMRSRPLLAIASSLAIATIPSLASAAEETVTGVTAPPPLKADFPNGGDYGAYLVERFGGLVMPNASRGSSGAARGSGLEARYVMPAGWGGYFRYSRVAQSNQQDAGTAAAFVWDQWDVTFGLSRRLQATPQRVGFREQLRLDVGFSYSQAGTNLACSNSAFVWAISCDSGTAANGHPTNASGSAFGMEARLSLDFGVGPIGLGVDFGGGAYKSLTHGSNSEPLPSLFYSWNAQLRAGLSWTIE
jgi:hypothetical protein